MVSNAPGYARTRKNIRKNKADFTSETTRVEKRHIVKSAQKAKRTKMGNFGSPKTPTRAEPSNTINEFWSRHNGKTVTLNGIAYKIHYSEYNAVYPYKHVAVSIYLDPINKRSEYYLKTKRELGDDWSMDAKDISDIALTKIFRQLER